MPYNYGHIIFARKYSQEYWGIVIDVFDGDVDGSSVIEFAIRNLQAEGKLTVLIGLVKVNLVGQDMEG